MTAPSPKTYGQEPWRYEIVVSDMDRGRTKSLCVFDADQNTVCVIRTKKTKEEFASMDMANAIRIVASVNWCRQ